jgi:hypothetical protein
MVRPRFVRSRTTMIAGSAWRHEPSGRRQDAIDLSGNLATSPGLPAVSRGEVTASFRSELPQGVYCR